MSNRKFNLALTSREISEQIARLLNAGGQLGYRQRYGYILTDSVIYYLEMERDKVVGVVGVEKKTIDTSEIKHLCVHEDYRGQGIGTKLLATGVIESTTPFVYGVVREDNNANIHNNLKLGFLPVAKVQGIRGKLIVFARGKDGITDEHFRRRNP